MAILQADQERAQPVLSSHEILRIAQADAEKVYRDLSRHRITLTCKPDGWHVDYDYAEPFMAGGGPHYIIDPISGIIKSRRYDQ